MRLRKKNNSVKAQLEKILNDYHCNYDIQTDENGTTVYDFEFQAGHFIAAIRKQDDCVEVTYPTMATFPMSQLPLVRSKCNQHNNSNILFKFTYSINEEKGEIQVHMSFFNNSLNAENFTHELKAAFHFQHEWTRDYDEAVSMSKDYNSIDLESELYKHQREMHLLRSQERIHQISNCNSNEFLLTDGTLPLPLIDMLQTIEPIFKAQMLFLTVNTISGQQRLEDEKAILNYDLRRALVEGEGDEARLVRDYAVLDLHYKLGHDEKPMMATIALTAEGDDKKSVYTRVTVTLPVHNASRANSLNNDERFPHSKSFLIALDRDAGKQFQEFKYMWTDAQLKMKNGEQGNMSEEEILLSQEKDADVAYNLYWGQQYFSDKRFYEAITHLENVFNSHRKCYFDMKGEEKRMFMEVAYKLGFCYNELGLYKQAYYYLDLMANDGNIRHTMELVNTMANSRDLRVFNFTDGVMEEVKRNFENEDEVPDSIRQFVNFLRRRRGYALIDFGQLDEAEKIFMRMLHEEENSDYAQRELTYIQHLRSLEKKDNQPDDAKQAEDSANSGSESQGHIDLPF